MPTLSPKKPSAKAVGHAAHTQSSDNKGLPGLMPRPIKVTMLGAGSGFTPRLMNDILRIPGEQGGTLALVDIDIDRLKTMTGLIKKLIVHLGKKNWKVIASPNRRLVMKDSDYIVNCIEVSGLECVRYDNDIPAKYGIDQCIGDTIGPGGLFKALRTVPVWLEVLKDAERLCPQALVLNYTNPMNMMCLAAGWESFMPVVGLCHSVQGTSHLMAKRASVPYSELEWECAGINHLAWFTKLKHQGRDLYPQLKKEAREQLARAFKEGRKADKRTPEVWGGSDGPEWHHDMVRKDMMVQFGAFITESSGHLSEYLPYYRKRKDILDKYLREGYDGGSSFYARHWPDWRKTNDKERMDMLRGKKPIEWDRSWEYASWIIEAREKDTPFRIHGNVMNDSENGGGLLIDNLPANGCVEVACMVDRNGVQPTRYGSLPPQMAALCRSNMGMFELGAMAAVDRSKEAAIHALLLDPLTAAVCGTDEIRKMTLEMFAAEKKYLPGFR